MYQWDCHIGGVQSVLVAVRVAVWYTTAIKTATSKTRPPAPFPRMAYILLIVLGLSGAEDRSRTDDLLITNQLLYQLSYFGLLFRLYRCAGGR